MNSKGIPTVNIAGVEVSRLVVGGNPFSANSHVSYEMDLEMEDYYTTQRIKDTLRRCEECGIGAMQLRADRHIARLIKEYRAEGGSMAWIAQTAPEYAPFEANLNLMRGAGAAMAYLQGTVADALFKAGQVAEIRQKLAAMRGMGIPVGLGTHMPEVIARAEDEGWDVDFYLACVYNLSKVERVSKEITGRINNGEPFDDEDIPIMYGTIRAASKPCLAFKILGATRRCGTPEGIRGAFEEAYRSIKPTDAVVVGVFQKYSDQVAEDAEMVRDILNPAGPVGTVK